MRTNPFTAAERALLRRELGRHFGQDPRIADGLFLRTWRGGERRGQRRRFRRPCKPCWSAACSRSRSPARSRAFFTEPGLAALRQLVGDRRAMDPTRFAHLRTELGLTSE